jgi:hypothetical protein
MKKRTVLSCALAATVVLAGAVGMASDAEAAPGYTLSSLRGAFAFSLHGVNPLGQPFGAVGVFTADGSGHLSGTRVSVDNGSRSQADFTCEYTITADGLFSTGATCLDIGAAISEVTIDGALAENGKELLIMSSGLPAGGGIAVVTGAAHKQ